MRGGRRVKAASSSKPGSHVSPVKPAGGTAAPVAQQSYALPDFPLVAALVQLGWKAVGDRQLAAAKYLFAEAIRLNPQEWKARLGMARCFLGSQENSEAAAAEQCMLAAEINPWSTDAWFAVANSQWLLCTKEADIEAKVTKRECVLPHSTCSLTLVFQVRVCWLNLRFF
jgi:hypothetical protein